MNTDGPGFGEASGIDDLANLYVNALRAMIDAIPRQPDSGAVPSVGSEQEILMLLAKAQTAWLTSGLRYWKQMAEIMARNGLSLTEMAAGVSALDYEPGGDAMSQTMKRLVLIDRARACLREVSDASMSEAEALRRELKEIEADLRDTMDPGSTANPTRPHRHKP